MPHSEAAPHRTPESLATRDDPYGVERRRAVRLRLRWTTLAALIPIAISAGVNACVFSERRAAHLATLGLQGALCLLGAAVTWLPAARRWAVVFAVVTVLGIATVQFWAIALAARDADILVAAIVSVMMGATLLYPWGVGPQALVATYVAAGYLLLPDWGSLDAMRATNLLIGVSLGVGMSVWGALLLDRQRRATFVEQQRVAALARQRELLLEAGRELNGTVDLDQLVARVVHLAQRMVDCDVAMLTLLQDAHQDDYRMVAAARGRPGIVEHKVRAQRMLGFREDILERRTVEIPGGTPFDYLTQEAAAHGFGRMLLVAVHRDRQLLGLLAFNQYAREPCFSESRIRLAEGIANQSAIALANARLVDDLQRANRIKSEFVSTMSHELRTPLHVILGFAEMGRDPTAGEPERAECLTKIDAAGRDLLELIESTLAIGKLEAGRDAPEFETVTLPEFWATVGATCERMPRRPAVMLEWARDVPAVAFQTDPHKLAVILRNLVSNALKFTEAGRVRVTAAVGADAAVELVVADTGIGIRRADQESIFEMFRQADSSDARRYGGTGLGLYIVRQFVAQLGGRVALESTPGCGSTFTVTLPVGSSAVRPARAVA